MSIYQLRVVLRDISPLIWRRVLLQSESSLADLHAVLQMAFGWTDEYTHRFRIHGKDYGRSQGGGMHYADDPKTVKLSRFGLRPREKFRYVYNFTARWKLIFAWKPCWSRTRNAPTPFALAASEPLHRKAGPEPGRIGPPET